MRPLDPPLVAPPAPEPAYCPRCELKHTRRDDWLCPRCGSPVDTTVPTPRTVSAPEREARFPLGSRLAGGLLVLAGGAVAWGLAAHPAGAHRWRLVVAVAALVALGLALLLAAPAARWVAVALAAVAALVLSEGLLRDLSPGLLRDPLPAPARQLLRDLVRDHRPTRILALLGLDAGGLLLVLGRPRALRLAAGVLLAAPLLALQVLAALGR